jgi:hypothetical protein
MVKIRCNDGENTMLRWWKYDGMMIKTRYCFHHRVIASSWFHHCAIFVSSLHLFIFASLPLLFHQCTIVHSGLVRLKMLLMSKNTVISRYLNQCGHTTWLFGYGARRLFTRLRFVFYSWLIYYSTDFDQIRRRVPVILSAFYGISKFWKPLNGFWEHSSTVFFS